MKRILIAVAIATAMLIASFPLYWAVVMFVAPLDVALGDLWLPGVPFTPTFAAWERLGSVPGL